jgi:hypothetical protein
MHTCRREMQSAPRSRRIRLELGATVLVFLSCWFTFGCGAPGEPLPPVPPIPEAVTDLVAKQAGDGVLLTFTMPGKSTLGDKLQQIPTFEILRGGLRPDGAPDPKSFRVVDSVPGSLVSRYAQHGQVQFVDPISLSSRKNIPPPIRMTPQSACMPSRSESHPLRQQSPSREFS